MSDNGILVYLSADSETQQLTWLDRRGKLIGVIGDADLYYSPSLLPDDRRLAVARVDPKTRAGDIHVIDPRDGTSVRLTFDPADDFNPVWSPDGRYIGSGSRDAADPEGNVFQLSRR